MNLIRPLISAMGVVKEYRGATGVSVLKGIDFTVRPGERVSIIGKSGAGKSTLLHLLGTLERPTSGEILFEGEDVFSYSDARVSDYRNRRIGFVFQFHYLMLEFSALENVMIPMLLGGVKKKDARIRASDLLDSVGLAQRVTHKPNQLSGGEQQRVAIARALAQRPSLLLTDEMTGNLDPETGLKILDLVSDLQRQHSMAVISVTHDESVARRSPVVFNLENGTLSAI